MYGWIGPMNCLDETHDKDNSFLGLIDKDSNRE